MAISRIWTSLPLSLKFFSQVSVPWQKSGSATTTSGQSRVTSSSPPPTSWNPSTFPTTNCRPSPSSCSPTLVFSRRSASPTTRWTRCPRSCLSRNKGDFWPWTYLEICCDLFTINSWRTSPIWFLWIWVTTSWKDLSQKHSQISSRCSCSS